MGESCLGVPLVLTIPHSGEVLPPDATWLRALSPEVLLTDVDRFVDQLYARAITEYQLSALVAKVHRYAVDLNRYPEDVDRDSVVGSLNPSGKFPKGFHWVSTTKGAKVLPMPISRELHEHWVREYHDRFHAQFAAEVERVRAAFMGRSIYHLDCHSMPSRGTGAHTDAGAERPNVVLSDLNGTSASPEFMNLVCRVFREEGFSIARNHPYQGGRITQRYGHPAEGHETVQVELNRALYMDEQTREKTADFAVIQERLLRCLAPIVQALKDL